MQFTVPIIAISVDQEGVHLAISGFINGNLANILLDTGASKTVIDRNRVGLFSDSSRLEMTEEVSVGLGTDGMEIHDFPIDQLIIGDVVMEEVKLVALDLSHINAVYSELHLPPIDMVLGGDFLNQHQATIDYQSLELTLHC